MERPDPKPHLLRAGGYKRSRKSGKVALALLDPSRPTLASIAKSCKCAESYVYHIKKSILPDEVTAERLRNSINGDGDTGGIDIRTTNLLDKGLVADALARYETKSQEEVQSKAVVDKFEANRRDLVAELSADFSEGSSRETRQLAMLKLMHYNGQVPARMMILPHELSL